MNNKSLLSFAWVMKPKDDIDDIFSSKPKKEEPKKAVVHKSTNNDNDDGFFDTRGLKTQERRYTEDGFPIYTDKELGFTNTLGDTDECPFDCKCCY